MDPVGKDLAVEGVTVESLTGSGSPFSLICTAIDDGHSVGRTLASCAGTLAAEAGVVEVHTAVLVQIAVESGHRGHHLLMDQAGGVIADARVKNLCQRQKLGLFLAEPEGSHGTRCAAPPWCCLSVCLLLSAGETLEQSACGVIDHVVRLPCATLKVKSFGPTKRHQRRLALLLAAVVGEELRQLNFGLKLNAIHRHR